MFTMYRTQETTYGTQKRLLPSLEPSAKRKNLGDEKRAATRCVCLLPTVNATDIDAEAGTPGRTGHTAGGAGTPPTERGCHSPAGRRGLEVRRTEAVDPSPSRHFTNNVIQDTIYKIQDIYYGV